MFNDISIAGGIEFVRHLYSKNGAMFQATKLSAKDKIDRFDLSINNLPENEHVTFGVMGQSLVRVYKSGIM